MDGPGFFDWVEVRQTSFLDRGAGQNLRRDFYQRHTINAFAGSLNEVWKHEIWDF